MQDKIQNIFKTDVIIPIGTDCLASFFLKDNNLRKMATPFDWQESTNVNLDSYIYYFKDFSNFFKERVNLGEYNVIMASSNNDGVDFRLKTLRTHATMGVFEEWQEVGKISDVKNVFNNKYCN